MLATVMLNRLLMAKEWEDYQWIMINLRLYRRNHLNLGGIR